MGLTPGPLEVPGLGWPPALGVAFGSIKQLLMGNSAKVDPVLPPKDESICWLTRDKTRDFPEVYSRSEAH